MASRPLAVAIVAMALLVTSVGFEVLFNRSYALDVRTDAGWVTVGTTTDPYGSARPMETSGAALVTASREEALQFRLRVDNGYPWSLAEAYDVRVGGVIVAEGTLAADGRAEGTSEFSVRAALFLSTVSKETLRDQGNITFAYLDVQVADQFLGGSFQLEEVDA